VNPDEKKAYQRAWRVKNRERINAARRLHYAEHGTYENVEKRRASARAWLARNRDCVNAKHRVANQTPAQRQAGLRAGARYRAKHPHAETVAHIKCRYGLTKEQLFSLAAVQFGECAICRKDVVGGLGLGKRVVDHNHITGKVRSLLCTQCNAMVGMAGDSPNRLRVAAEYLEKR
jgi:hypothetical protein